MHPQWLFKRTLKALAAAVANFGCSGKPSDSDKQRFCSGAENSRITICAAKRGCKVASKRQRMLLPVMAYHSLVQKKRNAGSNNIIIMIHGSGVYKSLVVE